MRRLIFGLWLGGVCFAGVGNGWGAAETGHGRADKAAAGEDLFTNSQVLRIQVEIPRSGLAILRNAGWGNGQERPAARATVREGATVYTNVAVHLKGAAGSFRSVDDNPAFTLNFQKLAPGQTFHGLHKVSLNNSVQDPSFLSEKICREMFEAAGVPVPRAAFAKVSLNGRDLGLHVLIEGYDKQFLKRYFPNAKGNLYDGGFIQDITSSLAVNSGDNPKDNSGLRALAAAAGDSDPAQRWARLEQTLDVDRFASLLAMDVIQDNWDGYARNRNNWRIFHDLDSNRMVFMPHGLDQMFGVDRAGNRGNANSGILPRMSGMVARAFIGAPEGRRRYLDRLGQVYTNCFPVEAILQRIDVLAATIHPVVAESGAAAAHRHDQEVRWLKQRIVQRDESLRRQISMAANPQKLATNGPAQLTGWQPRTMAGAPVVRESEAPDGKPALYIGSGNGNTIGSWRTRALLEAGTYRFAGRIQTKNVKSEGGDDRAGAGLRTSGGAVAQELSGTADWRSFVYQFKVPDGGTEVEFICELRSARGEAWFDRASLQAVRVR